MLYQYIIIVVVLLIFAFAITKITGKDSRIEMNKLVGFLGGKHNIKNIEANKSRCKVEVVDVALVNKEGIQKLGAQGIVEIDNTLKIILGKDARMLKRYIDEYILDNKKEKRRKKKKIKK